MTIRPDRQHRLAWVLRATGTTQWVVAALAGVAVAVGQVWAVFFAPVGGSVVSLAGRTYLAGEVAGNQTVGQTFVVEETGLGSIWVQARAWSSATSGTVVFDLRDETGGNSIARTSVPASEVLAPGGYMLRSARLGAVRSRLVRLVVSMPDAPPGTGIGLTANREDTYHDGSLFVGDREQWGDLVFRTVAARPTVYSNLDDFLRHRGSLVASRWFLLVLLIVVDAALWVLVAHLFRGDEAGQRV